MCLNQYFEMVFLEILLSVNSIPIAGHLYYCFLGNSMYVAYFGF